MPLFLPNNLPLFFSEKPNTPQGAKMVIRSFTLQTVLHFPDRHKEFSSQLYSRSESRECCSPPVPEMRVYFQRTFNLPRRANPPPTGEVRGTCAHSIGAVLQVQVLSKGGHPYRSETQLRKGDRPWEGSVERTVGPMDKNRVGGGVERARNRKTPMVKAPAM